MTAGTTIYNLTVSLSNVDRGVYEEFKLQVAQHPSESVGYLAARILGYLLEYQEGISFTKGLSESEEPAVWAHDPTGRITLWLEVGAPRAERLHKASKLGARVVVYTHRDPEISLSFLKGETIHQAHEIQIISFDPGFVDSLGAHLTKRTTLEISVSGGEVYLTIEGQSLQSRIIEHRIES